MNSLKKIIEIRSDLSTRSYQLLTCAFIDIPCTGKKILILVNSEIISFLMTKLVFIVTIRYQ